MNVCQGRKETIKRYTPKQANTITPTTIHLQRGKMISYVKPTCANCRFFARFTQEAIGEEVGAAVDTDGEMSPEYDEHLIEFGKCVRYPPQFFHEVLNGEWPVVHETKFCGEWRAANSDLPTQ